jgi:hypothetical protein
VKARLLACGCRPLSHTGARAATCEPQLVPTGLRVSGHGWHQTQQHYLPFPSKTHRKARWQTAFIKSHRTNSLCGLMPTGMTLSQVHP